MDANDVSIMNVLAVYIYIYIYIHSLGGSKHSRWTSAGLELASTRKRKTSVARQTEPSSFPTNARRCAAQFQCDLQLEMDDPAQAPTWAYT